MSIIEVQSLTRRFNGFTAVDGVTFTVNQGEIFGFLGPNGAGKSTTIKVLATLLRPTGGSARLAGHDVVQEADAVRRSIGLVFQDPSLDERLTAEENLIFHAMLYDVPGPVLQRRLPEVLEMVDLADRRRSLVRTFSGGMKRRLEIARGLLHHPRVLFLDEPTVGLDPQTRAAIWEHVRRLRDQEGVTVFMTTHYMEEAENCDRIGVIDHGKLVALDSPASLKQALGGDVVILEAADAAELAADLSQRHGVQAEATGPAEVQIRVAGGPEFIPRALAGFPGRVRAVRLRQPTLDDVFLGLTGRRIRAEEASDKDHMRQRVMIWRGGNRR